jgi:putative ABC transport system substrate-binding protein
MKRRDFIASIGLATAWTLPARAQLSAAPVVGYLGPESPEFFASRVNAFRDGLAAAGFVEGRNVAVEYRWAEGRYARLPALAAELAERQVAVIVAPGGAQTGLAAKSATSTIPIVVEMGGDPVALGIVPSLNRPGGNITGVSSLNVEVGPKRIEIMRELVPESATIVVAVNPTSPTAKAQIKNMEKAGEELGVRPHFVYASKEEEFDALFTALPQVGAAGLVFTSDPFFAFRFARLAALATQHRVPAIHQSRDFAIAGGLMSYGGNFVQSHRQAGVYAGRILNGEKPAELPVHQVTKLELFVNAKAANAIGIAIPLSVLGRADAVLD